jgi:hypothetical protein
MFIDIHPDVVDAQPDESDEISVSEPLTTMEFIREDDGTISVNLWVPDIFMLLRQNEIDKLIEGFARAKEIEGEDTILEWCRPGWVNGAGVTFPEWE